jgi:hypothetical protein
VLPQFGMRRCVYAIFMPPQIQSEHHLGYILVVSTEMQYVLYQRKIESRTRSMSHLLSSVDPVLYCDTNGPTHAPTVFSLASSAASVFADCALHCLTSQNGAFTVCALLRQLCGCSLQSSCFTPCFDLINSGEQCN